jgi:hypothetical protein
MRRIFVGLLAIVLMLAFVPPAVSTPVATSDVQYTAYGRVFPDPHGCNPGGSPFAKGNVCAADFLQFQELKDGMHQLEAMFPRFVEFYRLDKDFTCSGAPAKGDAKGCAAFKSAGIPVTADTGGPAKRAKQPLYMVRVTDESIPNKNKKFFVFPLSIHGIERAGVEGGTRAAEDLATWAACETEDAPPIVDCESEDNQAPHPLLEASPKKSITAGKAMRKSAVYFIYPNPDGWTRGERTQGTQFFQRYNGNGVDLNRDWPSQGFTFRPYTPWSEPETKSFGKVLQAIGPKDRKGKPKWSGGIDLHGQLVDRAFSFTLIGGQQRPYDKNQRVLQTVKGAWKDAEERLAYSPLIKPNSASADDPRVYGVQWGTIWDSIAYTVTGALGDWIDSPIGLNADGIDNEMSLSHLSNCGVGSCFDPDVEQLHVDGNKSLIYSMINYSLKPEDKKFRTKGRVGYIFNKGVIKERTKRNTVPPKFTKLPPQDDIHDGSLTPLNEYTQPFRVKGPGKGVYNGGIAVTLTCANAQGAGACALDRALLERKKPAEDLVQGEEWELVNSYYNQSPAYVQAGQALHANFPKAGQYRIRLEGDGTGGVFSTDINFTKEKGWEDPGQIGYRVSNMKFWKMMKRFSKPGLDRLTPKQIASTSKWKRRFDTIVVTNKAYKKLAPKLRRWVRAQNGNLVLTDKALRMLPQMGITKGGIGKGKYYAGYTNFATRKKEVTYSDPLARKINQGGAAEGMSGDEVHRRQTFEPVPLGMAIQTPDDRDAFNAPVWHVTKEAWRNAKGRQRAVGTTGNTAQISYGEIKYHGGRIRIIGGLLPKPTEKFDHPFGLASYALTYSGYQMLQNALTWERSRANSITVSAEIDTQVPAPGVDR